MNEESQRIAIAEACGFTEVRTTGIGHTIGTDIQGNGCITIPDYLNDLNAAIPLLGEDYDISCRNGYVEVTIYQPSEQFDGHAKSGNVCHAICEAFLQSRGLWTV